MKLKNFLLIVLFALSNNALAETREFREVHGLSSGWRLEQYTAAPNSGASDDMVLRFVNSTPCDNNIYLQNISQHIKNKFYAYMLASKVANKPVTLFYLYTIDDAGNKMCNLVSFAADY